MAYSMRSILSSKKALTVKILDFVLGRTEDQQSTNIHVSVNCIISDLFETTWLALSLV